MKRLFICESALQIIIASMLRYDLEHPGDISDIVVSNTFQGSETIAEHLYPYYRTVYYAKVNRLCYPKSFFDKATKLKHLLFCSDTERSLSEPLRVYDAVYAWNYDLFTANLRTRLKMLNPALTSFLYEEGFISYMPFDKILPVFANEYLINIRNKILRIGDVSRKDIRGIYLFEPEYLMDKRTYQIYRIHRTALKMPKFHDMMENVFHASKRVKEYDRKYIIFEEGFALEHPEINDYTLYRKIIDVVGNENVIIKLHPRSKCNRFANLGVKVMEADGVPWEAIVFTGNFSDKVLIAIGSGSLTNCRLMFGENLKSYLLFRFINTHIDHFSPEYNVLWEKIGSANESSGLTLPRSEKEFFGMLKADTTL